VPFAHRDGDERRLVLGGPMPCDILHPASVQDDEPAVAGAAADAIAREIGRPVLALGNAGPADEWWQAMRNAGDRRLVAIAGPENTYPFVELGGGDWDSYLATRSRNLRSQIGRKMRNLRRDHEVEVRRTSSAAELDRDLAALFRLHESRWSERSGVSSLDDRLRGFHRRFAEAALGRGWLRLLVIEIDGTPAAAWYGWSLGGRWSYYQAGFDPQWNRYSLGLLMLSESIRGAVAEGAREYDMLLGGEEFKSRFADQVRHARSVVLARPADPVRLASAARGAARRVWRRIPEAARNRLRGSVVRGGSR
jgi:CelD/BcsL family acetyltransferase involved in cellulose biosynthesis